jgi:hypothetical protein
MPQTSIPSAFTGISTPGVLADSGDIDAISCTNAEASASMPFGIAVAKGTADDDAILPAVTNFIPQGIAIYHAAFEQSVQAATPATAGILPKAGLSALRRGRVVVEVEEAVVKNDPVFVRFASGAGGTQKGAIRKSADTSTASDQSSWARFASSSYTVNAKLYAVVEVFRS